MRRLPLTWIIASERTPETLRHFKALSLEQAEAIVPAICPEEVANVFLTMERAKKLTAAQIATWTDVLKNLPIEVCPPSLEESLVEVRLLAQTHGLTAYDARYLHLAMGEGRHWPLAISSYCRLLQKLASNLSTQRPSTILKP